jgi:hypothetical protein
MQSALDAMIKIALPVPPGFERLCGYAGEHRYVAVFWGGGDELYYTDGCLTATGDHMGYLTLMHHAVGWSYFHPYRFGSSDEPAEHYLLMDTVERVFYVGSARQVESFLRETQMPKVAHQVRMSREEWEELDKHIRQQLASMPMPTMDEICAAIAEEQERSVELARWLDQFAITAMEKCPQCAGPMLRGQGLCLTCSVIGPHIVVGGIQ